MLLYTVYTDQLNFLLAKVNVIFYICTINKLFVFRNITEWMLLKTLIGSLI